MVRKKWLYLSLCAFAASLAGAAYWSIKPFGVVFAALIFFLCVLLPGDSIRRLLKLDSDIPEFNLAISYGLGLCLIPWVFSLMTYFHASVFALVVLAAVGLPSCFSLSKKIRQTEFLSKELPWVLICASCISFIAFTPTYRIDSSDKMVIPKHIVMDVAYNASLINAVNDSFPPENPFMAGQPLNYHVGYPDLLAMMGLAGHYDSIDVLMRFSPIWLWIFLLLACMGIGLGLGLRRAQARTATFLVTLVGGLFAIPAGIATRFVDMTPLYSLKLITASNFLSNATLVATPLALLAATAVGKSLLEEEKNWHIAAGILVFSLALYKSFFHLVLAAAWACSLILCRVYGKKKRILPWVLSTAASIPLWIWYMQKNASGANLKLNLTAGFLHTLGNIPFKWAVWLSDLFLNGNLLQSTGAALAGTIAFLILGLGIGLCGLPNLFRTLSPRGRIDWMPLGLVVVVGTCASMVLYDVPHIHVSSEWFFIASQFFLMVLAAPLCTRLFRKRIVGILMILVLFGGTLQAMWYMGEGRWVGAGSIEKDQVQAGLELARHIEQNDIVAIGPDRNCILNVLTGAPVYLHPIFYDLLIRYRSPENGALRRQQYENIFSKGTLPSDLNPNARLWVGFDKQQGQSLFSDERIEEKVETATWTWARIKP